MAQGDPQGWESLGTNNPTRYQAVLNLNRSQGVGQVKQGIRVITDRATGNYDVYTTQFGSGDELIFRYNASTDDPQIVSEGIYNQIFTGPRSSQLTNLNRSVRQATLQLAQNNISGGPNSTSSTQYEELKNYPGYRSLSNAATPGTSPQPQPPEQGGATTPTPTATPGESGSEGTSTPTVTEPGNPVNLPQPLEISKGVLRYPERMKPEQDKIFFQAVKISSNTRGGGDTNSLQFSFGEPKYEIVPGGPVVMAVQSPISDQNSVDWGPNNINAIESALYGISLNGMNNPNVGEYAQTELNKVLDALKSNQGPFQRFLAGYAAGVNNILPRTDGVILNPNLELLFQAPQLRPFTFQFKMSARDEKEAINIKSIIKYFKYHMSVRKDSNDLFLRAPHVFTIQYRKGETDLHPGINLISPANDRKACALTNCSVDYTPLGSYMTFRDTKDPRASGTMVSYTLSLQFQEITPIYNTDYEESPGRTHPIGY
jgi:hypothetical protein